MATVIDDALTHIESGIVNGVYSIPLSDHLPIFCNFDIQNLENTVHSRLLIRLDYEKIRDNIIEADLKQIYMKSFPI